MASFTRLLWMYDATTPSHVNTLLASLGSVRHPWTSNSTLPMRLTLVIAALLWQHVELVQPFTLCALIAETLQLVELGAWVVALKLQPQQPNAAWVLSQVLGYFAASDSTCFSTL